MTPTWGSHILIWKIRLEAACVSCSKDRIQPVCGHLTASRIPSYCKLTSLSTYAEGREIMGQHSANVRTDYSSGEVEQLLGLTQRQLGYWASTHVVEPSESRGSGNGRRLRFSFEDLVRLSVIKRLLN